MSQMLALVLFLSLAAEPENPTFYDVTTAGSTTRLKAGESGKLIIAITPKNGAHISDEAPLKIELSSRESTFTKSKLSLSDAVQKGEPRFEIPFTPTAQGPTSVEAKMTFFVCAEKQCTRQTRTLSFPVEVL
jgi:hypothetical protein